MHQKPLLSIILTIRNQRSGVEPSLTALFEMESVPFELFVIEDASVDGSSDTVQSLLDYYRHEQTYYFEHREPAGRGNSLNEALQQSNGSVAWIPTSVEQIDERLLKEAIDKLHESEYAFSYDTGAFPASAEQWVDVLQDTDWPGDGSFLWNMARIPSTQRFFNPFLTGYHALELAARLGVSPAAPQAERWHRPAGPVQPPGISPAARAELAYTLLRTQELDEEQRSAVFSLLDDIGNPEVRREQSARSTKLLTEATQMKNDGRFSAALELVEHVLEKHPGHRQARELKIDILERQRRFVEASELKHERDTSKELQKTNTSAGEIKTSIIVPTALYGKPALEHCLISVAEHCNPESAELIVIDNASLDDTHDYLEELQSKQFFNCKIITNKQNRGFAASVNQGLEEARGQYACILHNDVEFKDDAVHRLEQLMDAYPDYAIAGPLTDKTLNPDQAINRQTNRGDRLIDAEYLDSFCMMIRMEAGLRMDEAYQLAFFEDIDLCFQARREGHNIGIAPGITVDHHFGATTFALNLDTESDEYWKNVSLFNDKWQVDVSSGEELKSASRFDQLLALDDIVNPLYPEDAVKTQFEQLFTDEVKTEILKSDHNTDTLFRLVHLMMVMDQREVMRRLEDRLDNIELPVPLIYQLVRFYFNRNIYSRCTHYLEKLEPSQQSLQSELYRLKIMIGEKEMEKAIPELKELLEKAPANPVLYKLAGDIHQFEGNEEEAASFYRIAGQINPFNDEFVELGAERRAHGADRKYAT